MNLIPTQMSSLRPGSLFSFPNLDPTGYIQPVTCLWVSKQHKQHITGTNNKASEQQEHTRYCGLAQTGL